MAKIPVRVTPGLRALHAWFDSWAGLGHIVVGMDRQGLRLPLKKYGDRLPTPHATSDAATLPLDAYYLWVSVATRVSTVAVTAPSRLEIETVFDVFERNRASSGSTSYPSQGCRTFSSADFIGHRRSRL